MAVSAALAAPTPTAPVEGAVVPLDAVLFRWTAPPGAARFDLRVAPAHTPDAPVVEIEGLPTTEFTLADALPPGDAVWWVRRAGGPWSAPSRFRAGTPADVEVAQRDAAQAADAERARRREARRTGGDTLADAPPEPVWPHAQGDALDGAAALDWSEVPGFGAPARPDLPVADVEAPRVVGPLGGEVVDAALVSLRWTAVPGADAYEVELSPHAAFDRDVLALDAGTASEVALPGVVPATGRKLLWRVRARVGDAATAWSKYGRFYPAGDAHVDQFRADLDAALVAQRKQRDHARAVRQRELDLVPLHERPDAVTSSAVVGAIVAMFVSGLMIGLVAFVYMMTRV